VLTPLSRYQKKYRGDHWREIEFWTLQRGLNLAVGLSVELGWADNGVFAMMPYVEVFDRLLRQKFKTAGFVNRLFIAMLNSESTALILPYATAMAKSLQIHEKELPEMLQLLQLIPNCMLGTVENLKEWLDSVIKHSLEDCNKEFEAYCQSENPEGQNCDQEWVKIFQEQVLPLTQRLLDESEQNPERGFFSK
jgi:hypothetical protein